MKQKNLPIIKHVVLNWQKTNEPICVIKLYRHDFPTQMKQTDIDAHARFFALKKAVAMCPELKGKLI